MSLLEILNHYLKHQEDVVIRRTKYELNKAEERAHILEGLLSALISFLRTLVFQMAVVLLLPLLLGINGVWCSVAIAELLTLCVTGTFIVLKRNTYHYL